MSSTVFYLCWLVTMAVVFPGYELPASQAVFMIVAGIIAVAYDVSRLK